MSSPTLLAADPHLTPVRIRPALVFGGRKEPLRAESRPTVSARRGRNGRPGAAPGALHRRRRWPLPRGQRTAHGRRTIFLPPRREAGSPAPRRLFPGWRPAVAAGLVTLVAAGLGVLRVWPPFAVVMSGSMAPTINTGDMVVLQRLAGPARVGDVVAVPVPDDARQRYGYPPVVIHRVFRIAGGQIRTKGDARPAADPFTVPRTAVAARVVADIPAGGRVLAFFHSGPGLVWLLFGGALFFGLPLLERVREARSREADAVGGLREQLASVTAELARVQAEQERSRHAAAKTLAQIDRLALLVEQALAGGHDSDAASARVELVAATHGRTGPAGQAGLAGRTRQAAFTGSASPSHAVIADQHGPSAGSSAATGSAERVAGAESVEHAPVAEPKPAPPRAVQARTAANPEPESHAVAEPARADGPSPQPPAAAKPGADASAAPVIDRASAAAAPGLQPDGTEVIVPSSPKVASETVAAARAAGAAASSGTARHHEPAGVPEVPRACAPVYERWDAPPPATSLAASGWAAPPAPVRSSRFQRTGRLVAASLVRPLSAA